MNTAQTIIQKQQIDSNIASGVALSYPLTRLNFSSSTFTLLQHKINNNFLHTIITPFVANKTT